MYNHYQHAKIHLKTLNSRIEFLTLSMLHYIASKKVFDFFSQEPYHDMASYYPMLKRKILHRYLYCGIPVNKKAKALIDHYVFLYKNFTQEAIHSMYYEKSIPLLEIRTDSDAYILELSHCNDFYREGELSLLLKNSQNERIYSITFSFLNDGDRNYIFIGGIQGPQKSVLSSLDTIKKITKELHGLRPRSFMFFALRQLASSLKIDKIVAVKAKKHTSSCHRSAFKRFESFQADYNNYFEEEEAILDNHFYILPINQRRKSIDDIESKKRSLYKKRYAMMDDMNNMINTKLESMKLCYEKE